MAPRVRGPRHRRHALPAALELARERVAAAGLADRVEFRLQDYRTARAVPRRSPRSRCSSRSASRSTRPSSPPATGCSPPAGRCDPGDRDARPALRALPAQGGLDPALHLPRLAAALAGALQTAMSRASGLMVVGLEEIGTALRGHAGGVARAVLRTLPRGARARLRRPLHPDLGLLPPPAALFRTRGSATCSSSSAGRSRSPHDADQDRPRSGPASEPAR